MADNPDDASEHQTPSASDAGVAERDDAGSADVAPPPSATTQAEFEAPPPPAPELNSPAQASRPARSMTGVVTSSKADKTITVRVERRVKHPVYGKYIRRSTRLAAHDENNQCRQGDVVTIAQTRPISKTKSWTLRAILERASD